MIVDGWLGSEREDEKEAVRVLGLNPGEATPEWAIGELGRRWKVHRFQTEKAMEVIVTKAVKETGVPPKGCGGNCHSGNGVANVVIAVAKSTLSVFPGLAPEDGGESDEDVWGVGWEREKFLGDIGAELESVVFWGVVSKEGKVSGKGRKRRGENVGLSGVEVATAGINA